MDTTEIRQIEERAEAASPGPWTIGFNGSMRSGWAIQRAGTTSVVINLDAEKNISLDMENHRVDADLDFIQHAREDVPRLIAALKEARGRVDSPPEADLGLDAETQLTLSKLAAEVERLKATLYFYAHPDTYKQKVPDAEGKTADWIGTDLGARARRFFTPAE